MQSMNESLKELKNIVDQVRKEDPKANLNGLAAAFDLFTQETHVMQERLDAILKDLNEKISELSVTTFYLNSILSHISQGIIFIDAEGFITTYNSAAETALNLPKEQVLFHCFWDLFPDTFFGFSIKEALNQKVKTLSFLTLNHPHQKQVHLEIHPTFVHQANAICGLIILIQDVTALKELQIMAQRKDRLKELGEMAAQVAHEIRNPLGGIKGFAALLERDLQTMPEQKRIASYIVEGTERLNQLVTQILNYTRPLDPKKEQRDLFLLLKELKEHVEIDPTLPSGFHIFLTPPKEPIISKIDGGLIKSALLNLIVNAIQAMPKGGKITLSLEKQASQTAIFIKDTGTGIPKENLEKIFSPFFSTKAQGSGLGLSEAYKIAQAHGGELTVFSEIGSGSLFTLKLPND